MGEKIRNLYPIKIGDARLMIELNEGYYKNDGRLIHIQNPHFRYLLPEKNFVKLSSVILRARVELDYLKSKDYKQDCPKSEFDNSVPCDQAAVGEFCALLSGAHIRYRVVEIGNRYCSVLIHQEDRKAAKTLFSKERAFFECEHPYGAMLGYIFLYKMNPFNLIRFRDVFFEIFYQLPCMSVTPKTWIPLDRSIQELCWSEEKICDGISYLCDICRYLYRLGWAVFKDRCFSKDSLRILKDAAGVLDSDVFYENLKLVFFGYADRMLTLLKEEKFNTIIDDYYSYTEY